MRHFAPPLPARTTGSPIAALRKLELLFEAAGLGVWALDLATDRVWWSALTRRIHEVPTSFRPSLASALAFYAPEGGARLAATIAEARATGQPWDQTNRLVTAAGRTVLLRSCGRALPGPDGAMRWLLGTCEDVTETTARADEHRRLALVVEQMSNAAIVADAEGRAVWANPAFARLTGHPVAAFLGRKPGTLLQGPGTDPATVRAIGAALGAGQPFHGEILNYHASGQPYWIGLSISPIRGEDGALAGFVAIEEDVTARRNAETLLRDVVDSVPVLLSAYDAENRLLLANRMLLDWFPGLADVLVPGCPIEQSARAWFQRELGIPDGGSGRLDRLAREGAERIAGGVDALETRLPDGRWLLSSSKRTPSGNLIWVRTDITALKAAELQARDAASRDSLTGLLNRAGFMTSLKAMKASVAPGTPPAGTLLLVDVDHFKSVNDSYGHEAGDLLLRLVARRLARAVRRTDTVARLGGDEFALFLPEVGQAEAEARASDVIARCTRPLRLAGMTLVPSLSIGLATATPDIADCEELLRRTDRALYAAKHRGRGRAVAYTADLAEELATRRRLAERLRRALARGEVAVALQPQVRPATGQIDGFEALARWTDEGSPIPPPDFVAAADEHGLAGLLGQAILAQSLEAARALSAAAGRTIRVSVNISTAQLIAEDFATQVLARLAEAGLPASALELEITENVLLDRSIARLAGHLDALRAAGVRIALDDFGTGHASLAHLGTLPVDCLKVDRSFTAAIGRDRRCELLARTIIALARGLDLDCVVEGVETEAQRHFLEAHGCTHVQGWLTGRPMPLAEALALVRQPGAAAIAPVRRRTYIGGVRGG